MTTLSDEKQQLVVDESNDCNEKLWNKQNKVDLVRVVLKEKVQEEMRQNTTQQNSTSKVIRRNASKYHPTEFYVKGGSISQESSLIDTQDMKEE